MKAGCRKGMRVYVKWDDITASLHSEDELNLAEAETVGWVVRNGRKELELATTRYTKGCDCKDRITIHKGVVNEWREI